MKENWKINIGGCFCFIGKREDGTQEVFFASTDKKTKAKAVIKLVESACLQNFIELWIDNYEEFELKIGGPRLTLYAKHSNFPDPEKWYPVKNWMLQEIDFVREEQLSEYLTHVNLVNGVFSGTWTPLFNPDLDFSVNFISESMPEWEDKQGEILRRINFETGKKTTKWIPGHKYDSEYKSFWFLGEVRSRISHRDKNSTKQSWYWSSDKDVLNSIDGGNVSCFLTKSPAGGDDFWENVVVSANHERKDLNYFDILLKKPKVVDSGEWIESGKIWENPKEWRIGMVTRILKDVCLKESYTLGVKKDEYFNLHYALEPLYLYLGENDTTSLKEIGEYINPILTPVIRCCFEDILSYNGIDKYHLIGEAEEEVENKIHNFIDEFISVYIRENFYHKRELIKTFFEALDLSLYDLAEDFLRNFNINTKLKSGWENYLKNISYVQNSIEGSNRYFDLRKNSKELVLSKIGIENSKIEEVIKSSLSDEHISSDTKNLIVDMIKWSQNNNNLGLTKYWMNKNNEIEIVITLTDIINRYKLEGIDIPEEYKQGIMTDKFWRYTIFADKKTDWDSQ